MEERTYTLELSSRQVQTLRRACEILSRLHMLQFDMVFDEVMFSTECYERMKKYYPDTMTVTGLIRNCGDFLKKLLAPELHTNAYYGIRNDNTPDDTEIAYDIQQVLRHCQSWEESPPEEGDTSFRGVSYDCPMKFSKEPLPKISVKKIKKKKAPKNV